MSLDTSSFDSVNSDLRDLIESIVTTKTLVQDYQKLIHKYMETSDLEISILKSRLQEAIEIMEMWNQADFQRAYPDENYTRSAESLDLECHIRRDQFLVK